MLLTYGHMLIMSAVFLKQSSIHSTTENLYTNCKIVYIYTVYQKADQMTALLSLSLFFLLYPLYHRRANLFMYYLIKKYKTISFKSHTITKPHINMSKTEP